MSYEKFDPKRTVAPPGKREQQLWIVALCLLLIDVVTTWYVVSRFGLVAEGNPVMAFVMESLGLYGLLGSKVAVVGVGLALRTRVDSYRWIVPAGVIVPMAPVAVVNSVAIATLVL